MTHEPLEKRARTWLIQGGGGFEGGEDGIRACTMGADWALELMAEFARVQLEEAAKIADGGPTHNYTECRIAKAIRELAR